MVCAHAERLARRSSSLDAPLGAPRAPRSAALAFAVERLAPRGAETGDAEILSAEIVSAVDEPDDEESDGESGSDSENCTAARLELTRSCKHRLSASHARDFDSHRCRLGR